MFNPKKYFAEKTDAEEFQLPFHLQDEATISILPIGPERMEIIKEVLSQNSRILAMNFDILETLLTKQPMIFSGTGEKTSE